MDQLDAHRIERIREDVDNLKTIINKISVDTESIKRDINNASISQIHNSIQELKHSLFGVDGSNGFRSKIREMEIKLSKLESTQIKWAGVFIGVQSVAIGILSVLNYLK